MGIGLTACNILCKVMGGYIRADQPKRKKGSKFKFCIDVTTLSRQTSGLSTKIKPYNNLNYQHHMYETQEELKEEEDLDKSFNKTFLTEEIPNEHEGSDID